MFPKRVPLCALALALLLASLPTRSFAGGDDCKPKVDKNNLAIELGVPGYNDGRRFALILPVGRREAVTGGTKAGATQFVKAGYGKAVVSASYSLRVAERRDDGATLELSVDVIEQGGGVRALRRTIFVRHDAIVEQMFLGGVSIKAGFKMLPFKCKK
jgi:hypothetical protein